LLHALRAAEITVLAHDPTGVPGQLLPLEEHPEATYPIKFVAHNVGDVVRGEGFAREECKFAVELEGAAMEVPDRVADSQ